MVRFLNLKQSAKVVQSILANEGFRLSLFGFALLALFVLSGQKQIAIAQDSGCPPRHSITVDGTWTSPDFGPFCNYGSVQCEAGYHLSGCSVPTQTGPGTCSVSCVCTADNYSCGEPPPPGPNPPPPPPDNEPPPPPTPIDRVPTGNFEAASCDSFSGWAFDPDTPSQSIAVHVYKDGPPGVFSGGFTANISRPDVNAAFGITGNHGFVISPVPDQFKDGLPHSVYIYAINTDPNGQNVLIGGSPKSIPACPTPPVCPPSNAYSVALADAVVRAGQTTTAFAPSGWVGGTFSSSNTGVATVATSLNNGTGSVRGISPGQADISGVGWTASNGATGCAIGPTTVTVTAAVTGTLSATAPNICSPATAGTSTVTASANTYAEVRVDNAEGLPNNTFFFAVSAFETKTVQTGAWAKAGTVFRLVAPFDNNVELTLKVVGSTSNCPANNPTVDLKIINQDGTLTDGPVTIPIGTATRLQWVSQNTTSCRAVWTTSTATAGAQATQPLFTATTFTITCTGTNGQEVSDSVTVNVKDTPASGVDISISKIADKICATRTDSVTFTITATNNGPDQATNVVLVDAFDSPPFQYSEANVSQGLYDNTQGGAWKVGTLNAGATATLTLVLKPTFGNLGMASNTVSLRSVTQSENNSNNNQAQAFVEIKNSCTINPPPPPPNDKSVDISVTTGTDTECVTLNGEVVYTTRVKNLGLDAATAVTVGVIKAGNGLTYKSANPSQGAFSYANSSGGTWTVGALASGAEATLQFVATGTSLGTAGFTFAAGSVVPTDVDVSNNQASKSINISQNCAGPGTPSGVISADPNPCLIAENQNTCTSNVTWNTQNVTKALVFVSLNGGPESLFGNSVSCANADCPAGFITTQPDYYDFNLYDYSSGSRGVLLDTVRVTGKRAVVPPTDKPPVGSFDAVNCTAMSGWAFDPDSPSASIQVHVYRDGAAGAGGILVGGYATTVLRQDVNDAYQLTGTHGFSISPIPAELKDGQSHMVYIYAINTNSAGSNPLLSGSPKPVSCPPPVAVCPDVGQSYVVAADAVVAVGDATQVFAPNGWSAGDFVSSNTSIAKITNPLATSATVAAVKKGIVSIFGSGWTAPNGATNCSLGPIDITIVTNPTGQLSATPATYCAPGTTGVTTITATANVYIEVRIDGAAGLPDDTLLFTVPAFATRVVTTGPWIKQGTIIRLVAVQDGNVEVARQVVQLTEKCPPPGSPTVDLKIENPDGTTTDGPVTILVGTSVPLVWTSQNTIECHAAWTSSSAVSGRQQVGPLPTSTVFTIMCTNAAGDQVSDSVIVNVRDLPVTGADLSVSKVASALCVNPGKPLSFSILLTNNGPDNANNALVTENWSGLVSFASASPSQGQFNSSTHVWTVGALNAGQSATLNIVFTANATGPGTNVVAVNVSGQQDGNSANNISSVPFVVVSDCGPTNQPPTVDLKINGTDGTVTVNNGDTATLSWTSVNATECHAQDGWTNSTATSGSIQSNPVTANRSYAIVCTGPGGQAQDIVAVAVAGGPGGGSPPGGGGPGSDIYNTSTGAANGLVVSCGRLLVAWDKPSTAVDGFRLYYFNADIGNWIRFMEVPLGSADVLPGGRYGLEFTPPVQQKLFRYRVYSYLGAQEYVPGADAAGSPIAADYPCDSDLSPSNKDIIKIRGIVMDNNPLQGQDPRPNRHPNISDATPLVEGDKLEFAVNLVNGGQKEITTPITVDDVLMNLVPARLTTVPLDGFDIALSCQTAAVKQCTADIKYYPLNSRLAIIVKPIAGQGLAALGKEAWIITFTAKAQAAPELRGKPFRVQNKAYVNGLTTDLLITPKILVLPIGAPTIQEIQ